MAFNPNKCLKFEAIEACTITLDASPVGGFHYQFSKDGASWQADTITLNPGETCYVKGTNYSGNATTYAFFSISAPAKIVSGNIMSLVDDGAGEQLEITQGYGFRDLFKGCANLQSIPAGLLPATTLKNDCYVYMFYNCTGLTSLPENLLPATTLTDGCYQRMFQGCTKITSIPYRFLPAETLAANCYNQMFYGCSSLNEIYVPFTEWNPSNATTNWLSGVSDTGTFYCPDDLPDERGISRIPTNWTRNRLPRPPLPANVYFQPEKL